MGIMNENLGKTATDSITGFKGTVVGFCKYVTGCDLYLVLPKCGKDGSYPKGQWIDVTRLKFIGPRPKRKLHSSKKRSVLKRDPGPDMSPGMDSDSDDSQDGDW